MAIQDPRLKRPGAFGAASPETAPTAAPRVGGVPSIANPLSGVSSTLNTPNRLRPGEAAPDVNPQSAGTRFGNTLRSARRGAVNTQASQFNALAGAGAGLVNAATAIPRAIGGFTRDATRAATGMDPSANAGESFAGITAPQLKRPYPAPVVDFAGSVPAASTTRVTASGAGGSAPINPNYDPAADNISVGNLAAVTRPPAASASAASAPAFGGVQGGVLQSPVNRGTTVEGGRTLPVGAMIDGVATFSDGSGRSGIPRTMDDATIKSYGDGLSRADVGAAGNVLASDVNGGRTVTQDQMVDQRVAQIQRPITGSRPSAEQFAAAERNAIALRDPRSAAGIAARNLSVEAAYGRTPRVRGLAADQLAALQSGSQQSGLQTQQGEQATELQDQQGAQLMAQTEAQGRNTLANTALEQRTQLLKPQPGNQVTLADGTLGIQSPFTGAITPSKLADGTTAKAQVTRDDTATKRANEIMDQLNKGVQEQMKSFLPSKDMPEPTTEMITQWREQNARAMGLQLGTDPKTGRRVANINGQVVTL